MNFEDGSAYQGDDVEIKYTRYVTQHVDSLYSLYGGGRPYCENCAKELAELLDGETVILVY